MAEREMIPFGGAVVLFLLAALLGFLFGVGKMLPSQRALTMRCYTADGRVWTGKLEPALTSMASPIEARESATFTGFGLTCELSR